MSLKRQKPLTINYVLTCQSGVGLGIFTGAISLTIPAGIFARRHLTAYRMLYRIRWRPTAETYGITKACSSRSGLKRMLWLQSYQTQLNLSAYHYLSAVALLHFLLCIPLARHSRKPLTTASKLSFI